MASIFILIMCDRMIADYVTKVYAPDCQPISTPSLAEVIV